MLVREQGSRGCRNAGVPGRTEGTPEKVEEEGGDVGVMIRRDRGKCEWDQQRKKERERERESGKRERKVDGTTSLALMRAIQLPQCTSNTISPSPTSNEPSTGTGVSCECVRGIIHTYACAYTHTRSNTIVRIFKRKFFPSVGRME